MLASLSESSERERERKRTERLVCVLVLHLLYGSAFRELCVAALSVLFGVFWCVVALSQGHRLESVFAPGRLLLLGTPFWL